jgi:uncharacterized protein YndB with AHSA1/START domain
VSESRLQTHIDAPVRVVWDLIADVDRHPEWWPQVVEVECEGLEEGCTYRQVTQTPFGKDEMMLRVDELVDCEAFVIRCINTGTFVEFTLTEAQGGTFVDSRAGMEPHRLKYRVFDAVAGRRYFRRWLEQSLDAMGDTARRRAATST